jgi:hypothetical protein
MRWQPRDRGAFLTRTLFVLGLGLLGIVVLVLALRGPEEEQRPAAPATTRAPSTTTAPVTTTAPAAPVPVRVTAVTPFSVTVEWTTEEPTTGRVALALGDRDPALWSEPVGPAVEHRATVGGLAADTSYRVLVAGHALEVSTPRTTAPLVASTGDGRIMLDGEPFFPLMVWGLCPQVYGDLLNAGINLLAQNPCGGADAQVSALEGRALSAGIAGDAGEQNPLLIGWFYPDEADARRLTAGTLPPLPPSADVGRLSFLTLTNHFYSKAAPLVQGNPDYRALAARADVVGFDLYPLQNWCQRDGFDHVYDAQLEVNRLAAGKPTFQWIEASTMECGDRPGLRVTPRTVQLESWLALAAGAHGLGFFPGSWTGAVATAVTEVTRNVKAVAPALLRPSIRVEASPPLRASARELNGALYLVLANPERRSVRGSLRIAGAGDRLFNPVTIPGEPLQAERDRLTLIVPPLGGGIYVAAPAR